MQFNKNARLASLALHVRLHSYIFADGSLFYTQIYFFTIGKIEIGYIVFKSSSFGLKWISLKFVLLTCVRPLVYLASELASR